MSIVNDMISVEILIHIAHIREDINILGKRGGSFISSQFHLKKNNLIKWVNRNEKNTNEKI